MSGDSSGESLEAILASIRRSLAEQATNILEEEASPAEGLPPGEVMDGAAADLDAPPIPRSLTQQLAVAQQAAQNDRVDGPAGETAAAPASGEIAGDPLPAAVASIVLAPSVVPAAEAAGAASPGVAAEPAPAGQGDPLWFLGNAPEQAADGAGVAGARKAPALAEVPPASEPKPQRAAGPLHTGVLRGPLPPFFGSSAGSAKVEIAPESPPISGVFARAEAILPAASESVLPVAPSAPAQPMGDLPAGNGLDGWPHASNGSINGRAGAIFGPTPPESKAAGGEVSPQIRGLEAMVAELLRPMLRRWLDENMPRLVSAALKAEAEGMAGRDSKKP